MSALATTVACCVICAGVAGCGGSGPSAPIAPSMLDPEPNPESEPRLFERDFAYDAGRLRQIADAGSAALDPGDAPRPRPAVEAIELGAEVTRLLYEPAAHQAHALAPRSAELLRIDLASGQVAERIALPLTPSDLCLDPATDRLFIAAADGAVIAEHELSSYAWVRDLAWDAPTWSGFDDRVTPHFHVRCGGDALYAVDGALAPGLWRIPRDEGAMPEDLSASVREIGTPALTGDGAELYFVQQSGWSGGLGPSDVRRVSLADGSLLDSTDLGALELPQEPIDAPLVYDEEAGLVGTKHLLFEAAALSRRVHAFAVGELLLALDAARGRVATDAGVYRLLDYAQLAELAAPGAGLAFFDRDGVLYQVHEDWSALFVQELP